MRTLSASFNAMLEAQESGEVIVALITVDHDDLAGPIRVSSDPTTRVTDTPLLYQTTSRGNDFTYIPFRLELGQDRDDAPQRLTLTVSNAGRELVALVRSVDSPPTALVEILLASDLDYVEFPFPALLVSDVDIGATEITFTLTVDAQLAEQYPAKSFSPDRFPALFGAS